MSTNFLPIGTNVPPNPASLDPLHKTPQEIDVIITSLVNASKIITDPEFFNYLLGNIAALVYVRHKVSLIEARDVAIQLVTQAKGGV